MAEHGSNSNREPSDLPPLASGRPSQNHPSPWAHLLRYHMGRHGLTTRDMAERIGVSGGLIGHLLVGKVRPPIADQLQKIVQALHLDDAETELFELEALLGNAPAKLREYVMELRKRPAK